MTDPINTAPSPDANWRRNFEFKPWFTGARPKFEPDPTLVNPQAEWAIDPLLHKWSSPLKKK